MKYKRKIVALKREENFSLKTMKQLPPLSVTLFGSTLLRRAGEPLNIGLQGTTLELLWFLVICAGRETRREFIADRFWRNSTVDRQRSALNSAVWRIGKKLRDHPELRLEVTDRTLAMKIDPSIPVDAHELCDAVRAACDCDGVTQQAAERLEAALFATEAPFMDGFDGDWTLAERERISNIRFRGMITLMHWHGGNRAYEDALQIGRSLLHQDPYREAVQIDMMWLYVLNGQRVQAIKQYEAFAAVLNKELAIEPMRETRALYDHIRNELDSWPNHSVRPAVSILQGGAAQESLALGLAAAEQSRRDFYQTLHARTS